MSTIKIISSSFITLFLLSACAPMSQFKKMSAQQRAQTVCSTDPSLKRYNLQYNQLNAAINDSQNALNQGYRTHRNCAMVQVPSNTSTTNCHGTLVGANCITNTLPRQQYHCSETPVAIDANLEKSKITQLLKTQQNIKQSYDKQWNNCLRRVYEMPIKQAYDLYINQYFQ